MSSRGNEICNKHTSLDRGRSNEICSRRRSSSGGYRGKGVESMSSAGAGINGSRRGGYRPNSRELCGLSLIVL